MSHRYSLVCTKRARATSNRYVRFLFYNNNKKHRYLGVVLEGLVGSAGQVEVKPGNSSVVAAHDEVISGGVHVDAADPLAPADQPLH